MSFITLDTKPTAQICYNFHEATSQEQLLVVCLNGLGLPQEFWVPAITKFKELRQEAASPAILTYDRFGQGQTVDRDPHDANAPDPTHGHDATVVIKDLRQLIVQIAREKLGVSDVDSLPIVFMANSIGCAVARLYAQEYSGTVAGLLLLDSMVANTDFVSVFPDPDAEDFDPTTLPTGVSVQGLRGTRMGTQKIFHPDVGNKEGFSRRNFRTLLPASDGPALKGPGDKGPFLTVVGHDFDTFAAESAKMGPPEAVTNAYLNPYWHKYNEGLAKITEATRSKGPVFAPHSGHFVQRDNPDFVAHELDELISRILG
ncbi:Alpha/Beta hydrolase protein [Penicillium angulare]|uniref:Alpha/Beta hydrolase protein n=1 Tax=Penicillium angulare TaxID=116970 RepID=A0A9W9F3F0_9EURO|nr:Alpha/Beta hydrolase protein [Penicillium angulare]